MFGEYGNGFNQYPPMQQQSQYPFIQQKPSQFTPQPQQPVVKPPAMLYTVSNRTEVEAYMVTCDGSTTYFLCPAENCIYSKSVDMMGRPVINTFALQNSNPVQTIVTREMFDNLDERITALEGVSSNGQPTTISSANEPKSKPSSTADVRK